MSESEEFFYFESVPEPILRAERAKAREIRQGQWWKNQKGKGVCYYCGKKVPPAELTMDHKIPLARGGASTKSNLVPACKACNTAKKQMTEVEWQVFHAENQES